MARDKLVSDFPEEPFYRLQVAWSHFNIGEAMIDQNRSDAGFKEFSDCYDRMEKAYRESANLPYYREQLDSVIVRMCRILARVERRENAADIASRYFACITEVNPSKAPPHAEILGIGGDALLWLKRPTDAERLLRSSQQNSNLTAGWHYFYGRSLLGESLREQNKLDEAELYLKEGYQGMCDRKALLGKEKLSCLRPGLQWLIAWAEKRGTEEELTRWKADLAELDRELNTPAESKLP